ncbi:hypothetical protein G6011_08626 [Alternaria panax]|uniref:Knr4/Smi1-like domain-containing protein n=1 Tax=Alternaria panax TaxID=48097 RepID=A0AAD4FI89_9PLEO|nr:hypothetical protein G6011_08626 [Alternaria panax]
MATPLPLIPWSKTSILTCRLHLDSSRIAQHAALDLFVLGFAEQAYVLLETVHEYGLDTKTKDYYGLTTSRQLTGAWGASDSFPSWANEAGDTDWDYVSTTGLPKHLATKAGEHTLSKEDVEFACERLNAKPDATYRSPEETMTLGAVAQVASLAGEEQLATSLIGKNMKELYQYLLDNWNNPDMSGDETREWLEHRQGLQHYDGMWETLREVDLGEVFGVRMSDVEAYVEEGCALFIQRSTKGPMRPYRSQTMAELVQMIDKNICAERAEDDEDEIHTVLNSSASEGQIAALEERLSSSRAEDNPDDPRVALPNEKLPGDYKDFLRASNGIDEDLFFRAEDVTADGRWMVDLNYTLFPTEGNEYLTYGAERDFDEIELGDYTCITIGTGDHEGNVTLIPPTSVRPVIGRFEKAYAEASEANKKVYERAALDIYGGIEELRKLEWLCIEFQHSAYEQRIWGGLRPFLEEYAKIGVDERTEAERRQSRYEKKKEENKAKKRKREDGRSVDGVGNEAKSVRRA